MSLTKYFRFPFALTGDKTPIDEETQPSGVVSFQEGYGIDYELDPATEPSAKNIERDKANQLYFDITQAIKELQEFGIPYWIEAAQNGGVAFPYEKYALVRYDTGTETPIFQSLIDNNTDLPTVTASWRQLATAEPYLVDSATFEGSVTNGEIVYWDAANNRFDEAIADGSAAQNAVGIADVSNGRVYLFGSIPSGLLSGLSTNTAYYLSTTTPGAITTVRPAANAVQIGTSKAANTFYLNINAAEKIATESAAGLSEIATQTEVNTASDDLRYVTPLKLAAATSRGLGYGQTWQNVTGSRAINTTYTNTTGKPIFVSIFTSQTSGAVVLTVAGLAVAATDNSPDSSATVCAVVPNGVTYSCNGPISTWMELR